MIGDASTDGASATGFIAIATLAVLYFAPSIVAAANKRTSTGAIFALNILVGWTFLGWVVAFVWALKTDPAKIAATRNGNAPSAPLRPINRMTGDSIIGTWKTPAALPSADRDCPFCLSRIPQAASVCRFCQRDVPPVEA